MLVEAHAQDLPLAAVRPAVRIIGASSHALRVAKDPIDDIQSFKDTVLEVFVDSDELHLLRQAPVRRNSLEQELTRSWIGREVAQGIEVSLGSVQEMRERPRSQV